MAVRIVTDSACDLSEDEASKHGIEVVPLKIRFGDDEYVDRVELSVSEFYVKMATSPHLPSTAAPSPGDFEVAYRRLADQGADEIVCITLSHALSATGDAAESAAGLVAGVLPVTIFDSRSVTAGQGTQVLLAAEAAAAGASAPEVLHLLDGLRARTHVFGTLDTLENLRKGGRIGGAKAMLGTVLSIKPCVDVSTGVVQEAGRQRTRKKAMGWLRDELAKATNPEHVAVIEGDAPDVEELVELLGELVSRDSIRRSPLGAVVGSHGGPRVLGVTFLAGSA